MKQSGYKHVFEAELFYIRHEADGYKHVFEAEVFCVLLSKIIFISVKLCFVIHRCAHSTYMYIHIVIIILTLLCVLQAYDKKLWQCPKYRNVKSPSVIT